MAPKKPVTKSLKQLKQMSVIKTQSISTQSVKAHSIPQVGSKGDGCGTGSCGCSNGGTCAGCDGRCACKTWFGCHFLGVVKQKKAVAGVLGAFVILTLVQMLVHGHLLMPAYIASGDLWLPEAAMRVDLIYVYNIALALVFTMLFYVAQKFGDYFEGVRLGIMIMAPVALSGLAMAATQPIPTDILWAWSATDLACGALMGAWLTAMGRTRCCAGKWFGGCGKSKGGHHHHHGHSH